MSVPVKIFLTSLLTAVTALATVVCLLFWIAAQTDKIAAAEVQKRVAHAVDGLVLANATIAADYANWESAYDWYLAADDDALYDNLGSGAADSPSFDMIYLLNADKKVTHAYGPDVYQSDLEFVEPSIVATVTPLITDQPLSPYFQVSGLINVEDEVAAVSVGRIQPDDVAALSPTEMPLFIGLRWLDPGFLAHELLIDGMSIAPLDLATDPSSALRLVDINGQAFGQLVWQPPRPGPTLMKHVAPIVAMVALLLLVGSLIAGRVSAQQARDYLTERLSARTDPMTGVLNRNGLADVAALPEVQSALTDGRAALLNLDMNGLKEVNDNYGHAVGDAAIVVTAKRLISSVRAQDHVARMGGDEFVCLVIGDDPAVAARAVAKRFAQRSERPIRNGDVSIVTGASIGIALAEPGAAWDKLMDNADEAMYQAKRSRSTAPVMFGSTVEIAS